MDLWIWPKPKFGKEFGDLREKLWDSQLKNFGINLKKPNFEINGFNW